jgi:hypothetical protein
MYNSDVRDNINLLEYGKFVRLDNDARFPAISVTRIAPNSTEANPITSVDVYPKYGLITYLANPSDINISLSSSNVDIGNVGVLDHTSGNDVYIQITETGTVNGYRVGSLNVRTQNYPQLDSLTAKDFATETTLKSLTAVTYNTKITSTAPISGSITVLNQVSAVSAVITNTAAISGSVTVLNPITAVNATITNTAAVSGSVTVLNQVSAVSAIITNTAAVSGSVTVLNQVSAVSATITNPVTATITNTLSASITNDSLEVKFADSANVDAFSRLRVSTPFTLFDSKTLHNKSSLFWSQTISGTGAVNFTGENDASVTLSANGSGHYAIRQTTQRFNYQPGKSQLAIFTGVLTPVSNAIKRLGLFTSLTAAPYNPSVGLYFETQTDSVSSIAVVQQNSTNLVPSVSALRQNWNIDKLDGGGPSGKTLHLSAANIFLIDYEWLGVGRVRFGTVIDGQICYCHEINNAGNVQGAYIKSPNLPVRSELRQTGAGSATMKFICCTVMSEGGADFTGVTKAVDTGSAANGVTITTQGARRALLGLRLQAAKLDSVNEIMNASVLPIPQSSSTAAGYRFELVMNPTLGGTAVTWTDVDVNSNFQKSIAPDNTVTVSGGTVITSGYSTLGQTIDLSGFRFEKFLRLGCTIDGIRDQIWLVVTPIVTNGVNGFHGALTFIESD